MLARSDISGLLFVRIDPGEEISAMLTAALTEHAVHSGMISGIGAVRSAVLRFYDVTKKAYRDQVFEEPLEIASLLGNVSVKDGAIWPHLHAVLGTADFRCIGGHLHEAVVGVTCEVIVRPGKSGIERGKDAATGMMTWSLCDA